MSRLLLAIAAPSHILFLFAIKLISGEFIFTYEFVAFYLLTAMVQITILLSVCHYLVNILWRKGIDPDNSSIPFLTASSDLIGSALLALTFIVLHSLKDPNAYNDNPSAYLTVIFNNSSRLQLFNQ